MKAVAKKLCPNFSTSHQQSNWDEMKEVLGNWYSLQLLDYAEHREFALGRLVDTLNSKKVKLPKLAKRIKRLMANPDPR